MRVLVVWNGLPAYAAACLAAARIRCRRADIDIWGILPSPAQTTVDAILDDSVRWIGPNPADSDLFAGPRYDAAIVSGWHEPVCRAVARTTKANGAWTATMIDNRWTGSLRQIARAAYHRLFHSDLFDAAWVPGRAGVRTARALGFSQDSIYQDLYGADPGIYTAGPPLASRPKRFLYVGQLIERKNVLGLARAFVQFSKSHPEWELVIYGDGPDRGRLPAHDRIIVHPFSAPQAIANAMQGSRFLILPSHEEHWGVVVHEACLSGCGLILSRAIGAGEDLASAANCIRISRSGIDGIEESLRQAASWTDAQLTHAESDSRARAAMYGPEPFAATLERMLNHAVHN